MVAWRRLADVPPPPRDRFWLYRTAPGSSPSGIAAPVAGTTCSAGSRPNSAPRLRNGQTIQRGSACWRRSANLKPAYREALLLVHSERAYAEAAEALGCSVNAVGIRVHRAKERLRTLLGADSQADRPVPVAIKPNGVTDGS